MGIILYYVYFEKEQQYLLLVWEPSFALKQSILYNCQPI